MIEKSFNSFHKNQQDDHLFAEMFKKYFVSLVVFASKLVNDSSMAEDIVSDTFISLWNKRAEIDIESCSIGYLYITVKNKCLNIIKHRKIEHQYLKYWTSEDKWSDLTDSPEQRLNYKETQEFISQVIETLPINCRIIFKLSRFDNLKYSEIAEKEGISLKTVERQVSIALSVLRKAYKKLKLLEA